MPIHSKNKGNQFERDIVNFLIECGFSAVSSRSESKNLDDLGVDIVDNSPFSVQCKAVERLSIPTHDLLKGMKKNGFDRPIIMHKRNNKGVVVSMSLESFEEIIQWTNQ